MPIGTPPSDIFHNGQWYSRSGQPLGGFNFNFSCNVPSGLAPTGTVGANGALTLGTALSRTYNGGIFLYFPAGAVFAGSAAGSYWCVMSSTTVGTIFNNTLSGAPAVPAVLVPVVDAGPGAYAGGTAGARTVASFTIPGGAIGPNGFLQFTNEFAWNNSATTKTFATTLGGSTLITSNRTTSGTHDSFTSRLRNLGSEARNSFYGASESSLTSSTAESVFTIDTALDTTFNFIITAATATDVAIFQSISAFSDYSS